MEVGHRPSTKAIIFSANQVSYSFAPQTKIAQAQFTSTKAIIFSANQFTPLTKAIFFFSQSGVLLL
jgi:hypothetical protein